jgi:DNA-binding response OmpR family regulator
LRLSEPAVILLIGSDVMLSYLLKRFAELSGYHVSTHSQNPSAGEIEALDPAIVIFLSTELLETAQALVEEIANLDIPLMVCSSVADEARTRELGADYCLLHPLTYDGFQIALATASTSKHV